MFSYRFVDTCALIATVGILIPAPSASAFQPIIGGPVYNSETGTGYSNAALGHLYSTYTAPHAPSKSVGDGIAIGYAEKYTANMSLGTRALRWNALGASIELGNLGTDISGRGLVQGYAINADGVAVGSAYKYSDGALLGARAVRWDTTGAAAELGNLGTDTSGISYSSAIAINAVGTAVGFANKYSANMSLGSRAVRWDAFGTIATELDNLGTSMYGVGTSYANAINSAGTAVGYSARFIDGSYLGYRAVRWDATGTTATELGNLGTSTSGTTACYAFALNDSGTAVGWAYKYVNGIDLSYRAVRWDASGTAATELGNLGTDPAGGIHSRAVAINNAGTAVGYSGKYSGLYNLGTCAVRWDASGTAATELGDLGRDGISSGSSCYANDINDAGIIVGRVRKTIGNPSDYRAVYWGRDRIAVDLNTLLSTADAAMWHLTEANSISDTNWVVGIGSFDPDGAGPLPSYPRLFLMQIAPACSPCLADYDNNGGIDGSDLASFFADFEAGGTCADVDQNGGITGGDVGAFFAAFEAGGC